MGNVVFNVIISDAALIMLDSHVDFLARVSKNAALRLMNEMLDVIETLNNNPQRYPLFYNSFISKNNYRKMTVLKRYIVLYEVSDDTVFVDYILDCRQDYEWLLI